MKKPIQNLKSVAIVYPEKLPNYPKVKTKMIELVDFYDTFILQIIESREVNELSIIHRPGLKEKLHKKFPYKKVRLFESSSIQDIWIRDFAPVIMKNNIAYKTLYEPNYFQEYEKKYAQKDCNVGREFAENLNFKVKDIVIAEKKLILDGGCLIYNNKGIGITTNRIIGLNESLSIEEIKQYSKENFAISNLIILPVEPEDETGHIDAMVRFINDTTIVVGSYPKEHKKVKIFMDKIATYLQKELPNYEIVRIENKEPITGGYYSNTYGNYINFLAVGESIFLPQYGIAEKDEAAQKVYRNYFKEIVLVNHADIKKVASLGGVLNCITWNY